MMLFARRIEHALAVAIQRSHDADPRQHRRAVALGTEQQCLGRRLPFRRLVLGLGQLRDVASGIFSVTSARPLGTRIGSSKARSQPLLTCAVSVGRHGAAGTY
jgi:hypothetical protein